MLIIYVFFAYMFINMKFTHDIGSLQNLFDSFNIIPREQDKHEVRLLHDLCNDGRTAEERDEYYINHVDYRPIPESFDIPPSIISRARFG